MRNPIVLSVSPILMVPLYFTPDLHVSQYSNTIHYICLGGEDSLANGAPFMYYNLMLLVHDRRTTACARQTFHQHMVISDKCISLHLYSN